MNPDKPILGIVGPCAAGKSTLVAQLRTHGFNAKHIAQEHSYVQDMWAKIAHPDLLIYLDVSYEVSCQRSGSTWSKKIFDNQVERLIHARDNADLYVNTNEKTPLEVFNFVIKELE
jgi:deoxyadenosine/deoxycytidine kinase